MAQDDRELVRRALSGDAGAFEQLDKMYRPLARLTAVKAVGDECDAEDVVQEAMARAYTRLGQLRDPSKFGQWLASVLRHAAMDHLRRRLRLEARLTSLDELSEPRRDALLLKREDQPLPDARQDGLDEMLSALTPALAEAARLRFRDGLSLQEVARRLDVPLGTVKRRLHDAREKLRRSVMKTFDEKAAWGIVNAARDELAALPTDVKQDLLAVAVGGDLVRGDFVPNNSSLLVFPLISNRHSLCMFDSPAYGAVAEVFDRLCRPYFGCAECPTVWENLAFDEVHLPTTAQRFAPPRTPQPQWHSVYLFDLIDHHHVIYGEDFVKGLYRPEQRDVDIRAAAHALWIVRSGTTTCPAGFGSVVHWQALKLVRLLQLHFAPSAPTIGRHDVLANYGKHVPDFESKPFGQKLHESDLAARYPADRKPHSVAHVKKCKRFVEQACGLIAANRPGRS